MILIKSAKTVKFERSKKTFILGLKLTFFLLFNFDGSYSPNHVFYRKMALISIEAQIGGYLEPKKLRARPPNKAATPSGMKLDLFQLKGRGGFIWGPSP